MKHIDWESDKTFYMLNSFSKKVVNPNLLSHLEAISLKAPSVWLATSGTMGSCSKIKWVALTKKAILHSAKFVNDHLQVRANDIWVQALPEFHIGGLSIYARSYLSGSKVIDYVNASKKWSPKQFAECMSCSQATLTALVPTQLYDLIKLNIEAPKTLRVLLVGGGGISEEVYKKASKLKWPVLPTYGLTECASQVATAPLTSVFAKKMPHMEVLDHIKPSLSDDGCLIIKSQSLFTLYALTEENKIQTLDPKIKGSFKTHDRVKLSGKSLIPCGRDDHFIKIVGENVDLNHLQNISDEILINMKCKNKIVICDLFDPRCGRKIVLVHDGASEKILTDFSDRFNRVVAPYEKISEAIFKEKIPVTPLGKVKYASLKEAISETNPGFS